MPNILDNRPGKSDSIFRLDSMDSLRNRFLVSMPQLLDLNFFRTVVLICRHDDTGAIGIVINRLTSHRIGEIFDQLNIISTSDSFTHEPVLEGGPVFPEIGLVIHSGQDEQWESSLKVDDGLFLTSSRDILNDMATGSGPRDALLSFGYAGWGPGQLEDELRANSWLTTPVNRDILFSAPVSERWHLSAATLGIDISHVSDQIGHA